jgi:CheY-like chemotaxis protein
VLSLNIDWVLVGGERHVLSEIIDITEHKESEARQRQLAEQLAELNRELERRVSRYLTKPVKVAELTRALEELLERRPP